MSLLIVGTVAYDAIETPFGKTDKILGGAGTYIALAASYFTKNINMISIIGNDFEQKHLDLLTEHHINIEGIEKIADQKTFFWSGRYQEDLNERETIATELNCLASFDPKIPEKYQDCDILMLGNLQPSVQLQVIQGLKKRPQLIVMDSMNFWMNDPYLDDLLKVLPLVDVLCINEEEAKLLSKEINLKKTIQEILKMGPQNVIIKQGEYGAILANQAGEMFACPALPVNEIVDRTGAGDAFAGGFVGYLAQSKDISFENRKKALFYASNIASFCIQDFGTKKIENLAQELIQERLEKLFNLVKI